MDTFIKTAFYVALMLAMFCLEHDLPVMLYVRRWEHISTWKFAAYAQRKAIKSYLKYQEEVEIAHG